MISVSVSYIWNLSALDGQFCTTWVKQVLITHLGLHSSTYKLRAFHIHKIKLIAFHGWNVLRIFNPRQLQTLKIHPHIFQTPPPTCSLVTCLLQTNYEAERIIMLLHQYYLYYFLQVTPKISCPHSHMLKINWKYYLVRGKNRQNLQFLQGGSYKNKFTPLLQRAVQDFYASVHTW